MCQEFTKRNMPGVYKTCARSSQEISQEFSRNLPGVYKIYGKKFSRNVLAVLSKSNSKQLMALSTKEQGIHVPTSKICQYMENRDKNDQGKDKQHHIGKNAMCNRIECRLFLATTYAT